ncbi:MAG: hypothetical protein U0324_19835 [Polyangiales bacterium]
MSPRAAAAALVAAALASACAGAPARPAHPGAMPAGCPVEALPEAPARPVDALGEVVARCTGDAMSDVPGCTRALHDQACALGATLVWGVSSSQTDDALVMRAHAGRYR